MEGLEDKLMGEKKSYYLRGEDLFGDKFQGLTFEGRISTQKQLLGWGIFAEVLILIYSSIALFPPKAPKLNKILVMGSGLALGYVTWMLSEPEEGDPKQIKQIQNFFFNLEITRIKFDQFCIHNLIALTKAITSSVLMALVYFSHATHTIETDRLLTKARNLLSGKDSEEKVSQWCQEELDKLAEDHQIKI